MRLLNAIKTHTAGQDASAPVVRWGTVQSVDTGNMTAKVLLQPEGVLTDFLPIVSNMVGGGWGIVHAPAVGTQVVCVPDCGDGDNYIILGATWNTSARAPAVAQGELWLVHSTGSKISLTNDGHVKILDPSGSSMEFLNNGHVKIIDGSATTLEFTNNGTAKITGNLLVTGNITDLNGAHGTFAALRTAYDAHHHAGVQVGGGSTGTTDAPI